METPAYCVPDFGPVVRRERLLQAFLAAAPVMTVVVAPAGYGKSVLASQIARLPIFEQRYWLPLSECALSGDEVLGRLSGVLLRAREQGAVQTHTEFAATVVGRSDAVLSLRECFQSLGSSPTCVILDGAFRVDELQALYEAADLLRSCTSSLSQVLLTCRHVAPGARIDDSVRAWLVEADDLAFDHDELADLFSRFCTGSADEEMIKRVADLSAGQPALAALLARHPQSLDRMSGTESIPRDLLWYTERIVASLDDSALRLLYAASMLGTGRLGELLSTCSCDSDSMVDDAARAVPLLALGAHEVTERRLFRVHSVLGDVVDKAARQRLGEDGTLRIRARVLETLDRRGDYPGMAAILPARCGVGERIAWCESRGSSILFSAGSAALLRCLDAIPLEVVAGRPRLLLLRASALRQQERLDEALEQAAVARRLAEAASEWALVVEASLLIARLSLDIGRLDQVRIALGRLDAAGDDRLGAGSRCLVQAYLALADSQAGTYDSAAERMVRVRELLELMEPNSDEAVFALNCIAHIEGQCRGLWADAAAALARAAARSCMPPSQRLLIRANYAVALLETGRIAESRAILEDVLAQVAETGLSRIKAYALGTHSTVLYAAGLPDAGLAAFEECQRVLSDVDDMYGLAGEHLYAALSRRACGLAEESLALCERALELLKTSELSLRVPFLLARIELAASLLALGDVAAARGLALAVREEVAASRLEGHLLRVDMLLAEIERRRGRVEEAVNRLRAHAAYIAGGSPNWQVAMYVRCFPALLSLMAEAVGPSALPLRMLRLLPESTIEQVLLGASECMQDATQSELTERLRPGTGNLSAPESAKRTASIPCRVRLFGGLQVTTEFGAVDEDAWHKRKARLLFAMLAVKQGQDVPRDVILERLWPDMDASRARNNFYVIWSAMKRALACGGDAANGARYVQNRGGLCRVTRLVRSDLDDFEDAISTLRAADAIQDDATLLAAARSLMEIYRGELLPGDVYDDWFGEIRDRTRHDFCDAMMRAAHRTEARGEYDHALVFLRRANLADPWREDVYQATMRCQIGAGRRSSAVETYLTCRAKLIDDLGLDPSAETTRLYEMVLAMEEAGAKQAERSAKKSYAV